MMIDLIKPFIPKLVKKSLIELKIKLFDHYYGLFRPVKTRQVRNHTLKIGIASDLEHYRFRTYTTKEPELLDWLDSELKSGDVLYDIGANIGIYSLYAAKTHNVKVIAFEPESSNFHRFIENIRHNHANIDAFPIALSDQMKFDQLYLSSAQIGSALHQLGQHLNTGLKQGIFSLSIDHLIEFNFPIPNLIKIDVDGLELSILKGAEKTLNQPQLRSILVETNESNKKDEVESFLNQHGFYCTQKSVWNHYSKGVTSQNKIFFRQNA